MQKILVIIASILVIFLGGYTFAKFNADGVSREIIIGTENHETEQGMDIKKTINNAEDQNAVDNIMMIYLNGEQIEDVNIDMDNPDLIIQVNSPKQSTVLIDSKIWFTTEGAIIGYRAGESWDEIDFLQVNKEYAEYIQELINREE